MEIKVLVASHKEYPTPADKNTYLPVFVGSALKSSIPQGYQPDNTGDNISDENSRYNELTATYWGWKNLHNCDVVGLVHYRRYFRSLKKHGKSKLANVLSREEIVELFKDSDLVLPKKRKYYIETIRSHYEHTHDLQGIKALESVIRGMSPAYQAAFNKLMQARSAHMFNMLIMKKELFDEYCTWLFSTLRQVEKRIDYSKLNGNESRVLGFLGEFLIDIWVDANKVSFVEQPIIFLDNEHWARKAYIFLRNKFRGRGEIINSHIE